MKIIYTSLLIYILAAAIAMLVAGIIWALYNSTSIELKKKRSRQSFRDMKQMINERNLKNQKRKVRRGK